MLAKEPFTGPIPTVATPFTQDGEVDYPGLANSIEFLIQAGAKAIVLTAGNSHYMALSDREIAAVTEAVAKQAGGRAFIVAADRYYDTKQAVEFADHVKRRGCDMLMVLPPDWANSSTPETLADHYAAVAKQIPVMIVTGIFIPRGMAFGLRAVELALAKSDNILAIKDDMGGEFARRLALMAGEKTAVWAGGQKQNHLNIAPYGACGYLSTFLLFKPEIAWRYWNAFSSGDLAEAVKVIRDYDMPFFDAVSKCEGGFDAGIHGTMELFGIFKRWRPKPYHRMSDAELERLAHSLRELKIL